MYQIIETAPKMELTGKDLRERILPELANYTYARRETCSLLIAQQSRCRSLANINPLGAALKDPAI